MEHEHRNAIITILQLIDFVPPEVIETCLDRMDLATEAWDEELQAVKDFVKWSDS